MEGRRGVHNLKAFIIGGVTHAEHWSKSCSNETQGRPGSLHSSPCSSSPLLRWPLAPLLRIRARYSKTRRI